MVGGYRLRECHTRITAASPHALAAPGQNRKKRPTDMVQCTLIHYKSWQRGFDSRSAVAKSRTPEKISAQDVADRTLLGQDIGARRARRAQRRGLGTASSSLRESGFSGSPHELPTRDQTAFVWRSA